MNRKYEARVKSFVPEDPDDRYARHLIYPARPLKPSIVEKRGFVGRERELKFIRTTFGLAEDGEFWQTSRRGPLHKTGCQRLRLESPSGRGRRAVVREVARLLGLPLYELPGHAGMSAEDLVLAIVPRASDGRKTGFRLALQASPLATALLWGGIVYFDGMHRAGERALAPLASLLDGRMTLYSGATGLQLSPRAPLTPFYFICSWDPTEARRLPSFVDQRTLPVLRLESLQPEHVKSLLGTFGPTDLHQALETARELKANTVAEHVDREVTAVKRAMGLRDLSLLDRILAKADGDNIDGTTQS